MQKENIQYLYHYTNVSSLAMILQNQNIKFNPLTVLDDSEEEQIQDAQKYAKYCFVSSWTDDEHESIPMWNMYTNMAEGVRIRLPKNPFREYFLTKDDFYYMQPEYTVTGDGFKIIIPPNELLNSNYFLG